LGSLGKLVERGLLRHAYFVVERLCHKSSCVKALNILSTRGFDILAGFTQSIINRKCSLSREGDVAEVATEEGTEAMPYEATAVATELTTEIEHTLPTFTYEGREDVVFLTSLCHDQVSSFVLKSIIVSRHYVYYPRHLPCSIVLHACIGNMYRINRF
jgi:hypothetical protein